MSDGNKGKKYFKHPYNDGVKLFPIDYTKNELANKVGKDYRTIESWILQLPIFREELRELLMSEKEKERAKEHIDKNRCPIPLETGLFFTELAKFLERSDVSKLKEDSIKTFFQDLCNNISYGVDTLERQFYRHILMTDSYFKETVMLDFWESQLNHRFERLKKCIKGVQADVQMKVLQECFFALDTKIFELACQASSETTAEALTPSKTLKPLQDALTKLISVRNGMKITGSSGNIHAIYRIENVPIGDMTMKEFFRLKKPEEQNEQLEPARKAYGESILKEIDEPQFEKDYGNTAQKGVQRTRKHGKMEIWINR